MKSIGENYKKDLITETMRLWELNALEYRLLPIKYRFLLAMRFYAKEHVRGYGGLRVGRIPERKLDDYPEIEFLRIVDKTSAREYLEWLTYGEIVSIKHEVENYSRSCYAKNTLEARVSEFVFWWRNIDAPRNNFIAPESCGCGKHTTNYGNNSSSRDEHRL